MGVRAHPLRRVDLPPAERLPACTTSPGTSTRRRPTGTSRGASAARPPFRSTIRSTSRSRIRSSTTIPGSISSRAGTCGSTTREVPILREYLLRGGTLTFDDFHGPIEWANVERELKRVFPERKIIDLPKEHPIFNCFYKFDSFPQTPGLGSFLQGRTWEKGGYVAHLRAIEDDNGRAMVLINWNVDMGDGWEWSNATEYPGYVKYTAMAYRMEINEIIYALTH